ncbi:TonB-dependent receptor [Desulfoluna sp.]|uniref:TonB-dependent receptor plug domain-containing protein n=1 Tax=Desulfoluna sp. TaxID=2045199 RepID=UPI00262A025E|nr:TonB-dependent receptor [Desulfoluna sp.]
MMEKFCSNDTSRGKGFALLLLVMLVTLMGAGQADAHRANVFAWIDGDTVFTESTYPSGKKVNQGKLLIYGSNGKKLLEGETGPEGDFSFKIPERTSLRIVLESGDGHAADWVISRDQIEEALSPPPAQRLTAITVKARTIEDHFSGELEDFGHPVEIITRETIEEGGFTDLSQTLQALIPGLYLSAKGGRGDYATARIHGGSQILWLLDGVRLNNRLYGSGYLDTISVKFIERIEILKNSEGLYYGTDAASGVINIITTPVPEKAGGTLGFSCGSDDYKDIFGHAGETIKDHGFLVFGDFEEWDGYELFSSQACTLAGSTLNNKHGYSRSTLGIKYLKDIDLVGSATLKAHLQRNEGRFDFNELKEISAYNERTEDIAFLKWDHDVNDHISYYLKGYTHRWWSDHSSQKNDGTWVNNKARWGYEDQGVNLLGSFMIGDHEILAGGDYQNYWAEDQVWNISDKEEHVYAVFTEYRPYLSFSPQTRIGFGGRYNWTDEYRTAIWNANLKTPLVGTTYLRGTAGTAFRLPTAEQLYLNESSAKGNPDLEPEESLNTTVGMGGSGSFFHWDLGYFHQEITHKIDNLTQTSEASTWTRYENTEGRTRIDGFEFQARLQPLNELSLHGSMTYVDISTRRTPEARTAIAPPPKVTTRHHSTSHDDTNPPVQSDSPDRETGDTPNLTARAMASYRHGSGRFGTDLTLRYIGDIDSRYDSEIHYGDYFITDLSGFVNFGNQRRHRLSLRIENLFDQKYASDLGTATDIQTGDTFYYGYKGMPLTVLARYTYSF